ncbi:glycine betaine ABC transporter substrate-binding protein [Ectothiorhodospira variabilis]|uniref:glycine betaine ABC transporter substrate-binding protein n=1 Tax=Ectothiorhodospira variabilis TaxID=505694 RepID=UPI001EFC1960|nr:glycine betaine ABC transporter substrate-binding protein [Ectothiorhodospira variabilis]MCG5497890.1 glycine betaine ABC transporter substrate-binding protein [Ectothiorhodospira variabilis]
MSNEFKRNLPKILVGTCLAFGLAAAPLSAAADKGRINIPYVEWADAVASTNVMRVVLEEAGYDVRTTSVSAAAMWQSVASGDQDAFVAAWLPTTHASYVEELGDRVDDLGPNLEGTRIGLMVPTYVEIDSIDELNDHAGQFGRQIIGIDPGAGIMSTTEKAVEEYDLNLRLVEGSDATMTGVLSNAIRTNDWVVVTGWTPHWKEGRWDLKYLEDPKGVYGGEEAIHTVVRTGLKEDMPEAYAILNNFNWTADQVADLMVMNEEGGDPYENAKEWVEQNRDIVDAWLQ